MQTFTTWLEDRYQSIAQITKAVNAAEAALRRVQHEGTGGKDLINHLRMAIAARDPNDPSMGGLSQRVGDVLQRTIEAVRNRKMVPGNPLDQEILPELEALWKSYSDV